MIIVIIVDMEVKLIVKVMKGSGEYMNEKRFTFADGFKIVAIRDNGKIMNSIRVCELLNELHDENQKLKKENEELKQSYKEFEDECQSTFNAMSRKQNDLYRKNFKLKEENEQLKQQLKTKHIVNKQYEELQRLKKENLELKEILKHTYEIHECETCKHNENFNWLDPATMKREYNSKCSKGLYYDDEVHDCEEYELDLEMFKKRVKR